MASCQIIATETTSAREGSDCPEIRCDGCQLDRPGLGVGAGYASHFSKAIGMNGPQDGSGSGATRV